MNKCVDCEKELQHEAKFCSYCGAKQQKEDITIIDENKSMFGSFFDSAKQSVDSAFDNVSSTMSVGGQAISQTASKVGGVVSSIAGEMCDVNGDGKVDIEDLKVVTDATKKFVTESFEEAAKLGKEVLKSDTVKEAAAAAAVGAVVAIPVPLVGSSVGAAVGAGLSLYKSFMKK